MNEEVKAVATTDQQTAVAPFANSTSGFELAQRQANALAQSDIVPVAYKGKVANCLVALEIAHRSNESPLIVMQNLNIIHGRPSWSAVYIIGKINTCGRFDKLQFKYDDGEQTCFAFARDREQDVLVKGPTISIDMAKKEGWFQKAGSKWQSMPSLMLSYRAATFFGRMYCPEVLLGMQTQDEVRDVGPNDQASLEAAERTKRIKARVQS
ncbi:MAG: hypothetical protein EOO77_23060 [Oxalobacteraceae bacterium]|nr:MAG: hypothetical protein EOO77_23060 [Oxalobacteraceae bacterium]